MLEEEEEVEERQKCGMDWERGRGMVGYEEKPGQWPHTHSYPHGRLEFKITRY